MACFLILSTWQTSATTKKPYNRPRTTVNAMSVSADSIVLNAGATVDWTVDYGEQSPRSSCSYSSRDSRDCFIRPTPERAMKILQRLLCDKMNDCYDIPEVFDKHICTVIEKFCVVSVETQGSLEALSADNIDVFMRAMEDNHDPNIMKTKKQETMQLPEPRTSFPSIPSLSSIASNDSDTTKSVKKVSQWKKNIKKATPRSLQPGVMWRPTDIEPEHVEEKGLYVIKEHVLEEHIAAFETAIDQHEVDLVNELRCMKGKPLIDNKSCVVVNDLVYTTGGRACFPCIMETHQGNKYVSVFIHMNKSCRGHCSNNKTFMVECVATGAIIMKNPANELRFWKELCTSTICMEFRDEKKKAMAPTTLFHFEDVSHCRLFATELSDKECLC